MIIKNIQIDMGGQFFRWNFFFFNILIICDVRVVVKRTAKISAAMAQYDMTNHKKS